MSECLTVLDVNFGGSSSAYIYVCVCVPQSNWGCIAPVSFRSRTLRTPNLNLGKLVTDLQNSVYRMCAEEARGFFPESKQVFRPMCLLEDCDAVYVLSGLVTITWRAKCDDASQNTISELSREVRQGIASIILASALRESWVMLCCILAFSPSVPTFNKQYACSSLM